MEYQRGHTKVWTRPAENSSFRMIRLQTEYSDVRPDCLYDVLQDQVGLGWLFHSIKKFHSLFVKDLFYF